MRSILIIIVTFFNPSIILFAQSHSTYHIDSLMNVSNLSYQASYSERISITDEVNLNTLFFEDKLKFTTKQYELYHYKYLNNNGNFVHDKEFIEHKNMFPEWYSHPSIISYDEDGITMYFNGTNQYQEGGWTGGTISSTEHGSYYITQNGSKVYNSPFSTNGLSEYNSTSQLIQNKGLLYQNAFLLPNSTMQSSLQSAGYSLSFPQHKIVAEKSNQVILWDTLNKVKIIQDFNNGLLEATTISEYHFNSDYNTFLLSKETTKMPKIFKNGDCYEHILVTEYTNYSSNKVSPRRNQLEKGTSKKNGLSIQPNPVNDYAVIGFPECKCTTKIQIYNIKGNLVLQKQYNASSKNVSKINLSSLPNGVYFIKSIQKNTINNLKFIKL